MKLRSKLAAICAAIAAFLTLVAFFGVGRWLVVEDPLEKAQSIAVLSGGMPVRAIEAARLYRQGYAPEIWLTRSAEPAASLKEMNIPYVGEDYYNLRVLVHEGVPPEVVHVLPEPIANTADEIAAIGTELDRRAQLGLSKNRRVIIVTTKAHTRRVRTLWRKPAAARGKAIVRAASGDTFDGAHWWRNTTDALDVVREVLGLLNAWAGLRLHPAKAS
jgi:uncharacterized SAM-binding protein YcdF (DUF218 family)